MRYGGTLDPRATTPTWPSAAAAFVPVASAIVCGDATASAQAMRDVVLGASLGGDHSWTAPLPQLLAPLATLVPLGDVELRAAIALALPAAVAAALVARRACEGSTTQGGRTIALALGVLAGVLLARIDLTASMVVIAIEVGLRAIASPRALPLALPLALVAAAIATWATPRLGWTAFVPIALGARDRIRGASRAAIALGAPVISAAAFVAVVRGARAWLAIGRPMIDGASARSSEPLLASGLTARTAIATAVLASIAIGAAATAKKLHPSDRIVALTSLVVMLDAWLLRPFGGGAVAIAIVLPVAGAALGALHLAVDRFVGRRLDPRATPSPRAATLRVLGWIVPALALGWSARAFEDDVRTRRFPADASAAVAWTSIATLGAAPPDAVLLVDDEPRLVRWAHDRTLLGLRPDVRALPAGALLLGGASGLAARTVEEAAGASDVLRALIAHGDLDEPDVSPLTEHAPLLAGVPANRLRAVARHVDPTGGPLLVSLERVDPSDRRIHRPAIDRRLRFALEALAARPADDVTQSILRGDAVREARLASMALDREAATFALARARILGMDPSLADAWTAKLRDKKTLETEPATADD